jgi:hypothetical protein
MLLGRKKHYSTHQILTSREPKVQIQVNTFEKEITKMIDPRSQYIIYKEQETGLMFQIERNLAAQKRGEYAETNQPWYSAAQQWLKEKVFSRGSAKSPCIGEASPC